MACDGRLVSDPIEVDGLMEATATAGEIRAEAGGADLRPSREPNDLRAVLSDQRVDPWLDVSSTSESRKTDGAADIGRETVATTPSTTKDSLQYI